MQNILHNSDTKHKRSHELRFYGLSILCSKLITVSHKSNFYTRFSVSRELLHEIWLNGRLLQSNFKQNVPYICLAKLFLFMVRRLVRSPATPFLLFCMIYLCNLVPQFTYTVIHVVSIIVVS